MSLVERSADAAGAGRPRALTRAARRAVLHALGRLDGGALELELPDGSGARFGTGAAVGARVHRDDLFRRVALRGTTGLGEAYVAGDWDADDPARVLELLIRNAGPAAERFPGNLLVGLARLRPHLAPRESLRRSRRDIAAHYDLGNDLFRLFLDASLTYSCAYFEQPGESLEEAQRNKLRRICDKLAIGPDDHVLEIGCGWGSFAIHAAQERGARVTALTISRAQADLARARVGAAGVGDLVEIAERDYRSVSGSYTKIVSIEMLEAVGERGLGTFFAACDGLLAPDGLVGIQVITIPDQAYDRYRRSTDWIREYVFPGALLPSLGAMVEALRPTRLGIHALEEIGINYARTLREWRARFVASLAEVRSLGYDERFVRTWVYYLASCEAAFATRTLHDVQLVLTRRGNDRLPDYPAQRVSF
jgi:cyclopropane-fatty-acyl-phospholipid synthase